MKKNERKRKKGEGESKRKKERWGGEKRGREIRLRQAPRKGPDGEICNSTLVTFSLTQYKYSPNKSFCFSGSTD